MTNKSELVATPEERELIGRLRKGANLHCEDRIGYDAAKAATALESRIEEMEMLRERVRKAEMDRLAVLAALYHLAPESTELVCNRTLDPSGKLLAEVKKMVAAPLSPR